MSPKLTQTTTNETLAVDVPLCPMEPMACHWQYFLYPQYNWSLTSHWQLSGPTPPPSPFAPHLTRWWESPGAPSLGTGMEVQAMQSPGQAWELSPNSSLFPQHILRPPPLSSLKLLSILGACSTLSRKSHCTSSKPFYKLLVRVWHSLGIQTNFRCMCWKRSCTHSPGGVHTILNLFLIICLCFCSNWNLATSRILIPFIPLNWWLFFASHMPLEVEFCLG